MSKELTEQWRNGTLEESMYYVKLPDNDVKIANIYQLKQLALVNDADEIEVLAAVPTYDEFIQQRDFVKDHLKVLIENMNLKRKLDIATKVLKEYANEENWDDIRSYNFAIYDTYFFEKAEFREKGYEPAQKALKEIDLVGTSEKE